GPLAAGGGILQCDQRVLHDPVMAPCLKLLVGRTQGGRRRRGRPCRRRHRHLHEPCQLGRRWHARRLPILAFNRFRRSLGGCRRGGGRIGCEVHGGAVGPQRSEERRVGKGGRGRVWQG